MTVSIEDRTHQICPGDSGINIVEKGRKVFSLFQARLGTWESPPQRSLPRVGLVEVLIL